MNYSWYFVTLARHHRRQNIETALAPKHEDGPILADTFSLIQDFTNSIMVLTQLTISQKAEDFIEL
jgi:hypothetical protein